MKVQIRNGRLIDPASKQDEKADVFIAAGKVIGFGAPPEGFNADRIIEAEGLVVCPGLVDLSVRLREPGYEYKATLESELQAAVAGGVTSLACPPDTDPPLDEPGLVEMLKHRARSLSLSQVFPVGALTAGLAGERITEMAELAEAGCVAFAQGTRPIVNTEILFRAFQYASTFGFSVWLSPRDPFLGQNGVAHDGEVATRLGLPGIPAAAETIRLFTLLHLARETGVKMHVTRLSSAAGLALIREARAKGLHVTCDISVNHLHLSEMDIGYFNPHCHLDPPLRSEPDRDALRRGLNEGDIDAVCSDHTPVDDDAKQVPFGEAEPGASGVELLLSLTLKWGADAGLSLMRTLERVTAAPARILGVDCGRLVLGGPADLCVFDPHAYSVISRETLKSQGKNTPFLGLELPRPVRYTLVEGHIVYEVRG